MCVIQRGLIALAIACVSCKGVHLGGDWGGSAPSTLAQSDVDAAIDAVLQLGNETSDPRLHGVGIEVFDGYTVYTEPTSVFTDEWGRRVMGWTTCATRTIVIGTPTTFWSEASLTHELFHVMQGCHGTTPIDEGCDEGHANWTRDGIYSAILKSRVVLAPEYAP